VDRGPGTERNVIINGWVLWWKCNLYPLFPLIHYNCQRHEKPSPSLHISDVFQVSWLTSIDHYFRWKREIERSETSPWLGVRGEAPLAEYVSINQFIFEIKFNVSPYCRCIHYRQANKRNEHWHEMDIRKLWYNTNINICSIELKWDGKKLDYVMITRWGEYE